MNKYTAYVFSESCACYKLVSIEAENKEQAIQLCVNEMGVEPDFLTVNKQSIVKGGEEDE